MKKEGILVYTANLFVLEIWRLIERMKQMCQHRNLHPKESKASKACLLGHPNTISHRHTRVEPTTKMHLLLCAWRKTYGCLFDF